MMTAAASHRRSMQAMRIRLAARTLDMMAHITPKPVKMKNIVTGDITCIVVRSCMIHAVVLSRVCLWVRSGGCIGAL